MKADPAPDKRNWERPNLADNRFLEGTRSYFMLREQYPKRFSFHLSASLGFETLPKSIVKRKLAHASQGKKPQNSVVNGFSEF